jgi:hypothetical protein
MELITDAILGVVTGRFIFVPLRLGRETMEALGAAPARFASKERKEKVERIFHWLAVTRY